MKTEAAAIGLSVVAVLVILVSVGLVVGLVVRRRKKTSNKVTKDAYF